MPDDDTVRFVFSITSEAESYATMVKRTLENDPRYDIEITLTPFYNMDRTVDSWRIFGISKELRLGDLGEEEDHTIVGWVYSVATYFKSELKYLSYRL